MNKRDVFAKEVPVRTFREGDLGDGKTELALHKARRPRTNEGLKAKQISHATTDGIAYRPASARIVTLVNNKINEDCAGEYNFDKVEQERVTDVRLRNFDEASRKEFIRYANGLNNAHREMKNASRKRA